jgi:hypothetical protein
MKYLEKFAVNFWACVTVSNDKDACWKWKNSKGPEGYGLITCITPEGKVTTRAHRVSYELHIGQIPKGLLVLHRCDNPECSNPNHLFLGTNADNAKDRDAKGRTVHLKGKDHGCAKLTEDQVRCIYSYKGRRMGTTLAKKYKISQPTISAIFTKRLWKDFTDKIDLEKDL